MVMRRYISHLFTWVISFLTLLAFSSCLNEHPKDQLDGGAAMVLRLKYLIRP